MAEMQTQAENPDGLNKRYKLAHADGRPVDPKAIYFVLRLDGHANNMGHVRACREAARVYCQNAPNSMKVVANQLDALLDEIESGR